MKQLFLFTIVCLLAGYSSFAQDIITKKDGSVIKARISEVSPTNVKYTNYLDIDGPVFTISYTEIQKITYANGEQIVFKADGQNYPASGMKYKDYKDYYDTRNYVRMQGDPYSPFWIGVSDFLIPGLGNAIAGQWDRAAGFFFANMGLGLLGLTQIETIRDAYGDIREYRISPLYWLILTTRLGINIWGICDAVEVAKTKNMYNQALRAQSASLDLKVEPYFASTASSPNGSQPIAGLSLKVTF